MISTIASFGACLGSAGHTDICRMLIQQDREFVVHFLSPSLCDITFQGPGLNNRKKRYAERAEPQAANNQRLVRPPGSSYAPRRRPFFSMSCRMTFRGIGRNLLPAFSALATAGIFFATTFAHAQDETELPPNTLAVFGIEDVREALVVDKRLAAALKRESGHGDGSRRSPRRTDVARSGIQSRCEMPAGAGFMIAYVPKTCKGRPIRVTMPALQAMELP